MGVLLKFCFWGSGFSAGLFWVGVSVTAGFSFSLKDIVLVHS